MLKTRYHCLSPLKTHKDQKSSHILSVPRLQCLKLLKSWIDAKLFNSGAEVDVRSKKEKGGEVRGGGWRRGGLLVGGGAGFIMVEKISIDRYVSF